MKLLDDKYQKGLAVHRCSCGYAGEFTSPDIKGLVTLYRCKNCGQGYLITDECSKNRQGLHVPTIDLYNAITRETANYRHGRMTLRHLFYKLVSNGTLEKTEAQYDKLIVSASNMRKTGLISYDVFADGTRWQRKPDTYTDIRQALEDTLVHYRKDLWLNSPDYVEIWIEKDAIADIVYSIAARYHVPVMVARGFSSLTFQHDSAAAIERMGKNAYIYHIGDYDPSGVAAASSIQKTFEGFGVGISFTRLAVTPQQIFDYDLPTRPTKATTHGKDFDGNSVEVDAMPPHVIQSLVEDAILRHIDRDLVSNIKNIEKAEKETLEEFMQTFGVSLKRNGGQEYE